MYYEITTEGLCNSNIPVSPMYLWTIHKAAMSWTQATLFARKCQNCIHTKNENEMGNCIHGTDDTRTQVLHMLSLSNPPPASEYASLHVFVLCDIDIGSANSCLKRLAAYIPRPQPPYPQSCSAAVLVAIFIGRWGDLYVVLSRYFNPINPSPRLISRYFPNWTDVPQA